MKKIKLLERKKLFLVAFLLTGVLIFRGDPFVAAVCGLVWLLSVADEYFNAKPDESRAEVDAALALKRLDAVESKLSAVMIRAGFHK